MAKNYIQAVRELSGGSTTIEYWGEDINTVNFTKGTPIPIADIEAKAAEIEIRDSHIHLRHKAYPSIGDQLDMMWHDKKDGTTTWEDAVQAVKDANPKS